MRAPPAAHAIDPADARDYRAGGLGWAPTSQKRKHHVIRKHPLAYPSLAKSEPAGSWSWYAHAIPIRKLPRLRTGRAAPGAAPCEAAAARGPLGLARRIAAGAAPPAGIRGPPPRLAGPPARAAGAGTAQAHPAPARAGSRPCGLGGLPQGIGHARSRAARAFRPPASPCRLPEPVVRLAGRGAAPRRRAWWARDALRQAGGRDLTRMHRFA